jgi:hypothetical protein
MSSSFEWLPFPFPSPPADPDEIALVIVPTGAPWAVPFEVGDCDCIGLFIEDREPEEAAAVLLRLLAISISQSQWQ